jgi:hypothetical protein
VTADELDEFLKYCVDKFDPNLITLIDADTPAPEGWRFVDRGDGVFQLQEEA